MAIASRTQALRLTLLANDVLPEGLTWRIHEGYLRTATWNEEGESITLGLWGPLNRIRSAERRLLMLLRWLGVRFGQVSSRGYRLSLKEMNLTHRSLAEICGLTRVTVTKNLNRYKTLGLLQSVGEADLFIPGEALATAF